MKMSIEKRIHKAYKSLNENNLPQAKELIDQLEKEIVTLEKNPYTIQLAANIGGIMIDYGYWVNDFSIIEKGTLFSLLR